MRLRWWMLSLGLLGLALLAIVVGVILVSVQDVGWYREFIARKVSEKTGRELVSAGDFDPSISFSPSIVADEVSF